jgi:hypothetical protein
MQGRNARLAVAATVAVFAGCLLSTVARAEGPEWCPKAGTVVKMKGTTSGEYFRKYLGSAPDDRNVCLRTFNNEPERRALYNFPAGVAFGRGGLYTLTPVSLDRRRAAFGAVLGGETDKTSYFVVRCMPGSCPDTAGTETLARKGQEKLLIGGQAVTTTRLEYTFTRVDGGTLWGWDLRYDPERHIFLKGHRADWSYDHATTKYMRPDDWEVTSVSGP